MPEAIALKQFSCPARGGVVRGMIVRGIVLSQGPFPISLTIIPLTGFPIA